MGHRLVTTLQEALDRCSAVDLTGLESDEIAALVVDLRRVATRLEAEIARVVHAAEHAEIWRQAGATSMEAWLAGETRSTIRSAREQVRLANTLAAAPLVAQKMSEGALSIDNVRLIGAVVGHDEFAGDETLLVDIASGAPRHTRRGLEQWLAGVDSASEAEREAQMRLKRHLTFLPNGEGMYDVRGVLMPEDVAHVQAALDHIAGAAYADQTGRAHVTRIADAFVDLCKAYNAGEVSGGRERPKVLISVPFETVVERAAVRGVIVGLDATMSGEAVRRVCCDAELNRVVTRGPSTILDYGGTTRLASDAQYHAMVARDGGCRWPGCQRPPGWCEAHHIDEVIRDDGPTNLINLVLLCSTHHTLIHQQHWELVGDADDLSIRQPNGHLAAAPCRGPAFSDVPGQLELVGS